MVDFGQTDYFHAMDAPKSQLGNVRVKDFGVSSKIGDVLQSVNADIRTGAKHIEMVFMGTGKGSLGQMNTNPEMFDKVKRDEIRQLAKINEVTLSTHAAIQMSGAAGFKQQGFDEQARQSTLHEIKRTIEFAADTAGGGAVVVHTNEFPREVKDKQFRVGMRKELTKEEIARGEKQQERELIYLADRETGKVAAVPTQKLQLPKWKKINGQYVDIDDKPITKFRDYANRVPVYKDKENGELEWQDITFNQFKSEMQKEVEQWNAKNPDKKTSVEKEFVFLQNFQQLQAEQPKALEYLEAAQKTEKNYQEFQKKIPVWEELEKKTPEAKKEYLYTSFESEFKILEKQGIDISEELKTKKPHEILQKHTDRLKNETMRYREGHIGFQKNFENLNKQFENYDDIEKVGVEKSADTFARAAIYAYKIGKQKKLDKAIFVAPENMFGEWGYGGHPDELKDIVLKSRERMVNLLKKEQGINEKDAKKIAIDHIKATFDTGHANTWAKYFTEDPKLSPEENKKVFDKWLVGEAKKLIDEGIIGNVHLSDNFGYEDEHLNVGGGNAPLRDLVKLFKDPKYEGKIVVEWGAQGPEEQQEAGAMLAAWANLAGSPIYRVEGVSPKWSDIEHGGYFGASSSPFHVSGAYGAALSKDWRLWSYSEAPIE